jgi:calcineurin-like phosphoesterase family protein
MNEAIIDNYIEIVKEGDEVYFIGDVFWGYDFEWQKAIYDLLPGYKYLIFGNHDKRRECKKIFSRTYSKFRLGEILLVHDPYKYYREEIIRVCGHVHNRFKIRKNIINVSVEVWDYKPVSLEEVEKIIKDF